MARWKWIDPEWKPVVKPNETDSEGWIYTDNTWKNPGPTEAFGKYTVPIPISLLPPIQRVVSSNEVNFFVVFSDDENFFEPQN